jgi:hypothetical protein
MMTENAIKKVLTEEEEKVDLFGFPVGTSSSSFTAIPEGAFEEFVTVLSSPLSIQTTSEIAPGSIVGIFRKNENVEFLDQKEEWYRVIAPKRFNAWIQEKDW